MKTDTCPNCGCEGQETVEGLCPRCLSDQVRFREGSGDLGLDVGGATLSEMLANGCKCRGFGDYELLGEIARGGMGAVFRARQLSLNRIVAIKMILNEWPSEVEVRRFRVEAEAAANLDHPNIVTIYGVGEHGGHQFLTMRYVEGQSLACLVHRDRSERGDGRALALITAKIARAVHYAHQHGILHRDLKPANILVDKDGEPHVTDFGLAKVLSQQAQITQPMEVMGTPSYMAPEQASGKARHLTIAADVYGVGAILYALLTGQAPFCGESPAETIHHVIEKEAVRPTLKNPEVEKDLETICLKCLEKDPHRRYVSAAALAEDLDRFLRNEPIHAKPCTYSARVMKWCRRKPLIAGLAGSLCLVAGVGLLAVLLQGQQLIRSEGKARANEKQALQELAGSHVSQARARRMSGADGQRTASFAALQQAQPYYTNEAILRDELIAALALPDLAEKTQGIYPSNSTDPFELNLDAGLLAASAPDGSIRIRSTGDGTWLKTVPGFGAKVEKLRFAPGGRVLIVEYSRTPRPQTVAWDWEDERRLFTIDHGIHAEAIDFSPDGKAVAMGRSDGRVLVYSLAGGGIMHELSLRLASGAPRIPQVIRYHPSGEWLAESCLDDLYVQIWSLGKREAIARLPHRDVVHDLSWEPGGRLLATACRDSYVYLWKPDATPRQWKLGGHEGPVTSVSFNSSGTLLTSLGMDETIRLWTPATERHMTRRVDGENLERLQFSASTDLLMATDQKQTKVRVWETFGKEYAALHHRGSLLNKLNTIDFSHDGRWLAASSSEQATIWDMETFRETATIALTNAQAGWFTAGSERLLVSTGVGLFCHPVPAPGQRQQPLQGWKLANELAAMSVTPDRSWAAIAHPEQIFLVPLQAGTRPQPRSIPAQVFYHHLDLHPEGRWIAGTTEDSNTLDLRHVADEMEVSVVSTVRSSKYFRFSPDGQWLVACWNGRFEFFRIGEWTRPAFVIPRKITSDQHAPIAFTSDGTIVALASTRYAIQLFRLPPRGAGEPAIIATLESPDRHPLELLALSRDGRRLAAATQNQTIQVWNLALLRGVLGKLNLDTNWPAFPAKNESTP
jgi:eukaryotic-like serine/threonine-protein kinase